MPKVARSEEIKHIQSQLNDNDMIRILCIFASMDRATSINTDENQAGRLFGVGDIQNSKTQTRIMLEKIQHSREHKSLSSSVAEDRNEGDQLPPTLANESKKRKFSGDHCKPRRIVKRRGRKRPSKKVKDEDDVSEPSFDGSFD